MNKNSLHIFIWLFVLFSLPVVMAQTPPEINVPLTFTFGSGSSTPTFSGIDHAIGMDSAAQTGLDDFDSEPLPPAGPIEVDSASFRFSTPIGSVNSSKDVRPIASNASYLLDLQFSSESSQIVLEWDPAIFKSGGSVFDTSVTNATIGGSNTVGFGVFEIRETTGGAALVDLANPDGSNANVTVVDANTAQYTFSADATKFKTVTIVIAVNNTTPIAVDDPQNLVFESSPTTVDVTVLTNDIETDDGQTISIVESSFGGNGVDLVDSSFSPAFTLGTLAKATVNGADVIQFTKTVTGTDFATKGTDRFQGTFNYQVVDDDSINGAATSDPAVVSVTLFNGDIVVDRTLAADIAKAGEGEDIWVEDSTGMTGIYDDGADTADADGFDTKVFDGSPDDTNFSNWFTADGAVGITTGVLYNDLPSTPGYTAGEDIWQDVDSSGTYNTGDIQIYDGGNGWETDIAASPSVTGTTGLMYHDADGNGAYTHDETSDLGATVTLSVNINTAVVTDLTKFTIEETLPLTDDFMGVWYIPVTGYGATADSEILDVSASPASFTPKITGSGTSRDVVFSWDTNPTLQANFTITYRVVGKSTDREFKTTEIIGTKDPSGFKDSDAIFDPDGTPSNGDEITVSISNTGFQPVEALYHSADYLEPFFQIGFTELLRVVAHFNAGNYHTESGNGLDGYKPGAGTITGARHSADYLEPFGAIGFTELLRVVAHFNAGEYKLDLGNGIDDYAPVSSQ